MLVGSDRAQAVQSDQRAPRPRPRCCGQEGQRHADAAPADSVGAAAAGRLAGDHDGAPPTQAVVGEQSRQGWDHREETGLARGDRSGALGQQGQGLPGPAGRVDGAPLTGRLIGYCYEHMFVTVPIMG